MTPYTLISAIYTSLSAVHAWSAVTPQEIFVAGAYLAVAVVYLIAPYMQKDH
jgi:hypothetical protein